MNNWSSYAALKSTNPRDSRSLGRMKQRVFWLMALVWAMLSGAGPWLSIP